MGRERRPQRPKNRRLRGDANDEQVFGTLFQVAPHAMVLVSADWTVRTLNAAARDLLSGPAGPEVTRLDQFLPCRREAQGRPCPPGSPCSECRLRERLREVIETGEPVEHAEVRLATLRDDQRAIRGTLVSAVRTDTPTGPCALLALDRPHLSLYDAHIKQVLLAIRNVNQLIVSETDPRRLIERACATMTETLGYYRAWIVLLDEAGAVTSVASSGPEHAFLTLRRHVERGELPRCVREALKTDGVVSTADPSFACLTCPLAHTYAGRAGLTHRLAHGGRVYGALIVSVPAAYAHDREEQDLLSEVAGDLGFALRKIEDARALRASRERYREFITRSLEGVWFFKLDPPMPTDLPVDEQVRWVVDHLVVQECNDVMARMYGFASAVEVAGIPVLELMGGDDSVAAATARVWIDGGYGFALTETREMTRSGEERWFLNSGVSHVENGRVFRTWGTQTDITQLKQAQAALRESEQRYRSVVEQMTEGVLLIDPETYRVTEANTAVATMLDYRPAEMVGMRLFDLVAGPPQPVEAVTSRAMAEGIVPRFSRQYLTREGRPLDVEVTVSRIETGGEALLLGLIRDISEQKRAEAEKARLEARYRQAQKMEAVGRLAGGVAHDFNNMLSVILGNAELGLGQVAAEGPVHQALQEIRIAAQRSADLTRQLLAFARRQTVSPEVLDLNRTVKNTLTMLERLIGEDIDLAWTPGADLWPVRIDPSQIDQVLANLCVNARDAIRGVGKVTIETDNVHCGASYADPRADVAPGDYVLLAVSDNGRGMDAETLASIFEPFFTTKDTGKGTGLGLAMVYGIVRQNGGFVNVYSEPGEGTTFKIYLPRYHGPGEHVADSAPGATVERGHETVLFVEDEPSILRLGRTMLESLGYRVVTAGTPGEALALAREHPGEIHLLVTDVVMPEMNGRDLARQLLSIYPDLKRLFISGYTANVIAHHGVLDAGVHFIQKPFTRDDLATKVREALDRD
ncbi:MAG: PAS domain S-box protein [Planctomycetota bacterium]